MAFSLKHLFVSAKSDGVDPTLTQPSNWNAEHVLLMDSGKILGRTTAGNGAVEELASIPLELGGKPTNRYTNYGSVTGSGYTVVANPSALMLGSGSVWALTPTTTGRIRFSATGSSFVGAGGAGSVQGYYGSGTAPAQGAAVPGGAVAGNTLATPVPATADSPVTVYFEVTGLTIGTPYWFDFALISPAGGIRLTLSGVTIEEF